jgi:hypothetical protein
LYILRQFWLNFSRNLQLTDTGFLDALDDLGEIWPILAKFDHFWAESSANFWAISNYEGLG